MHLRLAISLAVALATGCAQDKAPVQPTASKVAQAAPGDDGGGTAGTSAPAAAGTPVLVRTANGGQMVIFAPGCVAPRPQSAGLIDDGQLDDLAPQVGDDKYLNDDAFPSGHEGPSGVSGVPSPTFDSNYTPEPASTSEAASGSGQAAGAQPAPGQATCPSPAPQAG